MDRRGGGRLKPGWDLVSLQFESGGDRTRPCPAQPHSSIVLGLAILSGTSVRQGPSKEQMALSYAVTEGSLIKRLFIRDGQV